MIPDVMQRAAESSITRGTIDTGIIGDARRILLARDIIESAGETDTLARITEWREKYWREEERGGTIRKEVWVCPVCKVLQGARVMLRNRSVIRS